MNVAIFSGSSLLPYSLVCSWTAVGHTLFLPLCRSGHLSSTCWTVWSSRPQLQVGDGAFCCWTMMSLSPPPPHHTPPPPLPQQYSNVHAHHKHSHWGCTHQQDFDHQHFVWIITKFKAATLAQSFVRAWCRHTRIHIRVVPVSADDKTYGPFLWQHLGDVMQLTWLHRVLKLIHNWLINVKLLFVLIWGHYQSPSKRKKRRQICLRPCYNFPVSVAF